MEFVPPPPGNPRHFTAPQEAEAYSLFQRALLTEDSLAQPWPPQQAPFEFHTEQRCRNLIDTASGLLPYKEFIERWQILQRGTAIANEVLSPIHELTPQTQHTYSEAHYNLVLEMLWMWLLDETLDHSPTLALACEPLLARISHRIAPYNGGVSSIAGLREPLHPQLMPLWEAIAAVLDEYNRTDVRPAGPLFCAYMDKYLMGYLSVHQEFTWPAYLEHRTFNGGYWSTLLHAATAFGWGDKQLLTDIQQSCGDLVATHSVVGAIANDLLGLEKDMEEGVTGACSVYKSAFGLPGEADAIPHLVTWYNSRLEQVFEGYMEAKSSAQRVVAFAALRVAWANVALYKLFQPIYRGTLLRSSLGNLGERPLLVDHFCQYP